GQPPVRVLGGVTHRGAVRSFGCRWSSIGSWMMRGDALRVGAVPVVADAVDRDGVVEVVLRAKPDVIVHALTAIGAINPRHCVRPQQPDRTAALKGNERGKAA